MGSELTAALAAGSVAAAPALLGAVITSHLGGTVSIRLTEVEAYREDDPASHSFRGRTSRTEVMFGPPGHLYVYFVYGMHWAANVSCGPTGSGQAVLLRAGEVVAGVKLARTRRPAARRDTDLARGPARLAQALALTRSALGVDLLDPSSPVMLGPASAPPGRVLAGPRVGISRATEVPWRWWLSDEPTVSAYRRGGRRSPPLTLSD